MHSISGGPYRRSMTALHWWIWSPLMSLTVLKGHQMLRLNSIHARLARCGRLLQTAGHVPACA